MKVSIINIHRHCHCHVSPGMTIEICIEICELVVDLPPWKIIHSCSSTPQLLDHHHIVRMVWSHTMDEWIIYPIVRLDHHPNYEHISIHVSNHQPDWFDDQWNNCCGSKPYKRKRNERIQQDFLNTWKTRNGPWPDLVPDFTQSLQFAPGGVFQTHVVQLFLGNLRGWLGANHLP